MVKVIASHDSIKRQIEENIKNSYDAFNEFLWNAIDANAKNIKIIVKPGTDYLKELSIMDDGEGINFEKLSDSLFGKFNTSQKTGLKEKNHSLPRGEKGFGRFSFIKFSSKADWETTYYDKKSKKNFSYKISIEDHQLDNFNPSNKEESKSKTGTKVNFVLPMGKNKNLVSVKKKDLLHDFYENICLEFSWIIELLNLNITINNKKLDYSQYMDKPEIHKHKIDDIEFEFKFIKWKQSLKNQSSRYYFLNSKGEEVFVTTTKLNDKSDEFYHSLYVSSEYFNDFNLLKTQYEKTYRGLKEYIVNYLKKKRKPYLKKFSARKYKEFEDKNLIPKFNEFENQVKKPIYEEVVREVIEFAPGLVSNTNDSQRKVLLELINKLLDDEQSRKILYNILEVLLDEDNREQLAELDDKLRKYGLKNILGTIRVIEDRLDTLKKLRSMVYEQKHYFLESDLQKVIEQHFWIFGEEYNLMLCKEEDDFTKLRNYYYERVLKLKKEDYEQYSVSKKQVDLFITGIASEGRKNKNLVVEIKRPDIPLIKKHYTQIDDYKDIILDIPELNTKDRNHWDFILLYRDISKEYKTSFENEIKDKFTGLAKEKDGIFRIFIVKWADLLDEVEFRLKFVKNNLETKKKAFIPAKVEEKEETKEEFMEWVDNSAKIKDDTQ
jgi:hypothetical protein